jgi:hypothetical protein
MSTLVSVDYDFLVPHGMFEKSIHLPAMNDDMPGTLVFDWQMYEGRGPTLDRVVWETRYRNFKRWGLDIEKLTEPKMSPAGLITGISCQIGGEFVPAWHADSHAWGAILARDLSEQYGPLNVVNFDAHHDLGYDPDYEQVGDEVDCGSWALAGLQQGHIANYTVVYPDWLGTVEMAPARLKMLKPVSDRITLTTWSEWVQGAEIDDVEAAFFCRSSSWVPPWLDNGFQELLTEWGYVECLDCRYGQMCSAYNSCVPRTWDWDEVRRYAAEMEDMHQQLLTGSISVDKLPRS